MLSRQHRLVNDKDFRRVYRSGRRSSTKNLIIIYLRTGQNDSRFGFIVSKKESSRVIRRNLVKRRLREIIRALEPGVAPGFDLVIKAKKTALDQTQEALGSEIEGSLKKLGMLRK